MKILTNVCSLGLALAITITMLSCQQKSQDDTFHRDLLVFDGHNDVLFTSVLPGRDLGQQLDSGHTDLPRLKQGGVDIQVFAVWSDATGGYQTYLDQSRGFQQVMQSYPDQIVQVRTAAEMKSAQAAGRIGAVLAVEGGHMIEDDLHKLEQFQRDGVRYLTLTWNNSPSWASSASDEQIWTNYPEQLPVGRELGLNDMGVSVVKRLNELGIAIDLSHVGPKTFSDVMAITSKPVLVTHSNAYALTPHIRNLTDEQILAVKANDGVIGINFYSAFLDSNFENTIEKTFLKYYPQDTSTLSVYEKFDKLSISEREEIRPAFEVVLDHIDYLVQKAGINHVSLGSDFDGIDSSPIGLDDVRDFPKITYALRQRGYSDDDIRKIMGENLFRVFEKNEVN